MEKRVLLAVTLSFLVLAAYQYFFVKPCPARRPASATSATAASDSPAAAPRAGGPAARRPASAAPPVTRPAEPVADVETLVADTEEREVVVETPEGAGGVHATAGPS